MDTMDLELEKAKDRRMSDFRSLIKKLNIQRERILSNPPGTDNIENIKLKSHDADFYIIILRRIFRIVEGLSKTDSRVANIKGKNKDFFNKIRIREHYEHGVKWETLPSLPNSPSIKVVCGITVSQDGVKIVSGDKKWDLDKDHEKFIEIIDGVVRLFPFKESIVVHEGWRAIKDDQVFLLHSKDETSKILEKEIREDLDYLRFYVFLHFCLEIGLAIFFRQILRFYAFIKTPYCSLSEKDMDKKRVEEKIRTLEYFIDKKDIDKSIGWCNNFAGKRNKILHGYWIGEVHSPTGSEKSKVIDWLSDDELGKQLDLYRKIREEFNRIVDVLPSVTEKGKEDLRNILSKF